MKIKPSTALPALDECAVPRYWRNMDTRQVHFFQLSRRADWEERGKKRPMTVASFEGIYPELYQKAPRVIRCKPGKLTLIPHWGYYDVYTRDGTELRGAWYIGDTIEDAALKSLSRGDAFGHEE